MENQYVKDICERCEKDVQYKKCLKCDLLLCNNCASEVHS